MPKKYFLRALLPHQWYHTSKIIYQLSKHWLPFVFFLSITINASCQFPATELIMKQHIHMEDSAKMRKDRIRNRYRDADINSLSPDTLAMILTEIPYNADSSGAKKIAETIKEQFPGLPAAQRFNVAKLTHRYFYRHGDYITCRKMLNNMVFDAKELNSDESTALALLLRSISFRYQSLDSTFADLDSALVYAKMANSRCLKSQIRYRKGMIIVQKGEYDAAEKLLLAAADSMEECPIVHGMLDYRVKYYVGLNYFLSGKYQQALFWFERTLKEHDKDMYCSDFWNIYEIMGNIYINLKEYDRAEEMHKRVLELRYARNDYLNKPDINEKGIAFSLNNLAEIYLKTEKPDTALSYAMRSLVIKQNPASQSSSYEKSTSTYNIADAWLLLGNIDSARKYNSMTETYIKKALQNHYLFKTYEQCARIEFESNNKDSAVFYANKAVKMASETGAVYDLKNTLKTQSKILESTGNYEAALLAYKHYTEIHDSIISESTKNKIAALEISHNTEKNKEVIATQKEKLVLANKNNRQTIIIFCLILIFSATIFILNIINRKKKLEVLQKRNKVIALEKEVIRTELEKKNSELVCHIRNILDKENLIKRMNTQLKHIKSDDQNHQKQYDELINSLSSHISDKGWEEFELMMQGTHPGFLETLKNRHPNLTHKDWKLCTLLRLNLTTKQIASIMHIEPASVDVARSRLRKKLGLGRTDNLVEYLSEI